MKHNHTSWNIKGGNNLVKGKGYEYPVKGSLIYLYESVAGKAHQAWECYAGL